MTTQSKVWTINDIKTACRVRGSHWFDPDTMRYFGCRISDTVFQGPGGIYFVSSEQDNYGGGPRTYTVRSFDPVAADIDTAGEFGEFNTLATAQRRARKLAGTDATATIENFRPVSVGEQFLHDCRTHGAKHCSQRTADELRRVAKRLQRIAERWCNGEITLNKDGEPAARPLVVRHARELAARAGAVGIITGGDPRGYALKLIWPDGATNDWGREGWGVPVAE